MQFLFIADFCWHANFLICRALVLFLSAYDEAGVGGGGGGGVVSKSAKFFRYALKVGRKYFMH